MKIRITCLFLALLMTFSAFSSAVLPVYANTEQSIGDDDFSQVSYTDIFYGYTGYLEYYNDVMRTPITDSIISAGEQFGIDDKFFASLETALDSVGSFSKTFYAVTDAIGLTSEMNDDAANSAIVNVLKNIYEDENSEFWDKVINDESKCFKALKTSFSFIENFNEAGYSNYTLNEIYYDILQQSISKMCEFDTTIGSLDVSVKMVITNTLYDYYKDCLTNWDYIIKLTKCINTVLFYQNVEVELIDYIMGFDNLDEDLIKGLKKIKSYIKTNYASYFAEAVTKEVIDKTLDKIGNFLGYGAPIAKLAGTACKVASWLFFDVIYKHADAKEYLSYLYSVKFLYSIQHEMNTKLKFFDSDLVYSATIKDFNYFYIIYSAVFKSSKKYAEKLLRKDIDYTYQNEFFKCDSFIDYIRTEVEKIDVNKRVEKATITDKTYKFTETVILSDKPTDSPCLVTFHNRILAPLVIDNNVDYDNCDLIVPGLTINRSLTLNNTITVNGNYSSGNVAGATITIGNNGILVVRGNSNIYASNHGYDVNTTSTFKVNSGGQFYTNNLSLRGHKEIGGGYNYINLYNYGLINVYGDLNTNSLINIHNYGSITVSNNANLIADVHWTSVTNGNLYIYNKASFSVNNMTLKGSNYYNTGNNWFHIYLYGKLSVNGNFSASRSFVSFAQLDESSVWTVNGDFYTDVLNEKVIYGFDVSSCQGYACELSAGKLVLRGDYKKGGGITITPSANHIIILDGDKQQNIDAINAGNIVINNTNGVKFNSAISVTTLFNHNRNAFTLYNSGRGSTFPDYDGDGYKDNVDPYPLIKHPDEHNYVFTETVSPTCTAQGYDLYICPFCNGTEKRNYTNTIAHTFEFSQTVLPTCTEQGYDLYICKTCNGAEHRNTVAATGHTYSFTKTVLPTCTVQGYDLYTCTICNGTESRNKVPANGHNYSLTQKVLPTCTEQGYDLYICAVCNKAEKRNTVESTGHAYEVKSNTATCTEAGIKTSVCSKCNDTQQTEVSALGHSYKGIYTAPTCTEAGGYTNTCIRCDDTTYIVYEKRGHDYGEEAGVDYINKISESKISKFPEYFNEYYHTSSSIGTKKNTALYTFNIAVPNEIKLNINKVEEVKEYQFSVYKGAFLFRKTCGGIFAYDKSTNRPPEQSAIPYTDKEGNLVNMNYVDYKVDDEWVCGEYTLEKAGIVDTSGKVVCVNFAETRPHIVYTRDEATEKGILNSDGTVNVDFTLIVTDGVSFSAGIPGVYFTATEIAATSNRKFINVFGFDESSKENIKPGKYSVNLCFYRGDINGLTETVFKIYDGSLIAKTPATLSSEEQITYTCIDCGETHTESCNLNLADFKIAAASLSLESNIRMNYKVLKTAIADFENPYIEVERNGKTVKITEYTEQGNYYVFSYKNIAPQCMGDTITAVLHGFHNGILYSSSALNFSVREYVYSVLQICNEEKYANLRTLLVDMLNYGAAAQVYMKYNTKELVNSDLTDVQKSWASSDGQVLKNIINPNYNTVEKGDIFWKGAGLYLYDSVSVRYTFTAEDISNLIIKVSCNEKEWSYGTSDIIDNGNGTYSIIFDRLNAHQMFDEIYITAYRGENAVSNTLLFSVESYAYQVQSTMSGSDLAMLTNSMIKYGASAKKYAK